MTYYKYSCKFCDKKFKVIRVLRKHEELHTRVNKTISCEICTKEFTTRSAVVSHAKSHLERKIIQCDLCPKTVYSSAQLQSHRSRLHLLKNNIMCDFPNCFKKFKTGQDLSKHLKIHSDRERPFKCKTCDGDYLTLPLFEQHSFIHTREKPFHCEFTNCIQSFNNSGTRSRHMQKCKNKK